MSALEPDRPRRNLPLVRILIVLVVAGMIAAAIANRARLEGEPPQIRVLPDAAVVGNAPIEIAVADAGAGLKSLTVMLSSGGTETPLATEQFAQPVGEKTLSVALAKVPGIKEGPVTLRVVARDASLRGWLSGNEATVQKELTLDLTPPTLELVADDRYVNFGGVGALVYRASADTATSGVRMGEHFFAGFPGQIKDKADHFFVLFAHPYSAPANARPVLVATDKAGNSRELPIAYELKNVNYRKSSIPVSDSFIANKVAPLVPDAAERQGAAKEVFVAVNRRLRKENEDRIAAVTGKGSPSMLWKGAFTQLTNSKVEANFADLRTYMYNGEAIDTSYHLGYDLSVTKRYPVEAANGGAVAFAGALGIYGNTVILDHGLGLFTLYSHLSAIDVKEGDRVEHKQTLGRTGETGLAAGDHLHYGVYLHGIAVLPVEWWDAKWIRDNIQPKLEGRSSEEIAVSQQPKSRAGAGGKRRRR
jgi:murein DD-endopeptidase MepM/ murein hydrolase activator NlpD